jgi:chromosomal replication initiation ATPase DnaA
MQQIGLPLDWRAASGESDFLVSDANRAAVRHLERWTLWPVRASILTGPPKSGRSHLARVFARWSGGEVIDDADAVFEEVLFHAWNRAQESRRPLLLVADVAPPLWQPRLPDLASRFAATPSVEIGAPDEALLAAVMTKQFHDRSLSPAPGLISYLMTRVERSFAGVAQVVDALDQAALSTRRRVGVPLARDVLVELGLLDAVTISS